jgi:hypothetical protein
MISYPVVTLSRRDYDAVVFDLDGVLAKTAHFESKAWQGSYGEASLDPRHAVARGTNRTAVTQDVHVLRKSEQMFKVEAMRTRWVLQDSRVSFGADDLYSPENDLMSGRALPNPPMSRTSLRGTIGVGSRPGVEVSGAGNVDSIAPNVAQSEERDAAGALEMNKTFANEVQRRLNMPTADQLLYGSKLQQALQEKSLGAIANEYVVLVDRNQNVQALFIYFRARAHGIWHMVGATPVSTGLPGTYDHFTTPMGVLKPRRDPTPWAGHYLVVIDSAQNVRPAWSPLPDGKARSQFPAHGDSAD